MLFIITGLAGAGKSTALHALEDKSVFCTDNLPVALLPQWVQYMQSKSGDAAVCLDLRSAQHADLLLQAIGNMPNDAKWELIFIDADDISLLRRFSTARRAHPIYASLDLQDAICQERTAILPLKDSASLVLDSSYLTPYELAYNIESFWRQATRRDHHEHTPVLSLVSFSYRRGIPANADMVMDMRFLPNPHYDPALAPLTGKDQAVQDFLQARNDVLETTRWLQQWLAFIWPKMLKERKRYFTLAMGCSGGRHRSVYMVEQMAAWARQHGTEPIIRHRELDMLKKGNVS